MISIDALSKINSNDYISTLAFDVLKNVPPPPLNLFNDICIYLKNHLVKRLGSFPVAPLLFNIIFIFCSECSILLQTIFFTSCIVLSFQLLFRQKSDKHNALPI